MAPSKNKKIVQGYDIDDPKQKAELTKKIQAQLKEGKTVKDALGVSTESLENVYSLAYGKYQEGNYAAASNLFRYIVMLDPHTYKYALGLAASLHRGKDYQKAANYYVMASLLQPKDPVPYFHSADCFIHIDQPKVALSGLTMAILASGDDKKYNELKERALLMKQSLETQSQSR
jgi:type III secretion system low calcium response chaperone LcrH/SycD